MDVETSIVCSTVEWTIKLSYVVQIHKLLSRYLTGITNGLVFSGRGARINVRASCFGVSLKAIDKRSTVKITRGDMKFGPLHYPGYEDIKSHLPTLQSLHSSQIYEEFVQYIAGASDTSYKHIHKELRSSEVNPFTDLSIPFSIIKILFHRQINRQNMIRLKDDKDPDSCGFEIDVETDLYFRHNLICCVYDYGGKEYFYPKSIIVNKPYMRNREDEERQLRLTAIPSKDSVPEVEINKAYIDAFVKLINIYFNQHLTDSTCKVSDLQEIYVRNYGEHFGEFVKKLGKLETIQTCKDYNFCFIDADIEINS